VKNGGYGEYFVAAIMISNANILLTQSNKKILNLVIDVTERI
jgi:hypothetical protein